MEGSIVEQDLSIQRIARVKLFATGTLRPDIWRVVTVVQQRIKPARTVAGEDTLPSQSSVKAQQSR